jgi:hypothetical protein
MKRMLWILLAFVLVSCSIFAVKNSRGNTESPAYRVVRADGAFEIREYPALRLAKTGMARPASRQPASSVRVTRRMAFPLRGCRKAPPASVACQTLQPE